MSSDNKYHLKLSIDNDELKTRYIEKDVKHNWEDAGYDLLIPVTITVPPRALGFMINHQVSGEMIKKGIKSVAYYLYCRSSISRTPLRMSNKVGIIDNGYRGNLLAAVDNLSDEPYLIEAGSRLFQICAPQLDHFSVQFVSKDQLSDSKRGTGGFGSTGK